MARQLAQCSRGGFDVVRPYQHTIFPRSQQITCRAHVIREDERQAAGRSLVYCDSPRFVSRSRANTSLAT